MVLVVLVLVLAFVRGNIPQHVRGGMSDEDDGEAGAAVVVAWRNLGRAGPEPGPRLGPAARRRRRRRLQDDNEEVELDWAAVRAAVNRTSPFTLAFPVDGALLKCRFRSSLLLPAALMARYPTVGAFEGTCTGIDGAVASASLSLDTARADSLSLTLSGAAYAEPIYVDNMETGENAYSVQRASRGGLKTKGRGNKKAGASNKEAGELGCGVGDASNDAIAVKRAARQGSGGKGGKGGKGGQGGSGGAGSGRRLAAAMAAEAAREEDPLAQAERRRVLAGAGTKQYVFRLALVTNAQYSSYHGNTKASVLTAVTALLARANGIFSRELGVQFQLLGAADDLFCLAGDSSCAYLPNTADILVENPDFIADRGFSLSDFDLGHSLTTGSGGLATYPSLCLGGLNAFQKAQGTTGSSVPEGPVFAVDFFTHEVGHQLRGAHSMRDCSGRAGDGNLMSEGRNEAGSGSTIMGYAGLCGVRNLQDVSDPLFGGSQLKKMRAYVEGVAASASCGSVTALAGRTAPEVTSPSACVVPRGNFFRLQGSAGADIAEQDGLYFAWERVDSAFEDFTDATRARLRPWLPKLGDPGRFFPNMYFITYEYEQGQQLQEIVPSDTASRSPSQMDFRLTARRLYNQDVDEAEVGDFGTSDTRVTFSRSSEPLRWAPSVRDRGYLLQEETLQLEWEPSSLTSSVQVLIALNTMDFNDDAFEYESDLAVLDWQLLATLPNTGSAALQLPSLNASIPVMSEVNLMIRSAESDECYFFDVAANLLLTDGRATDSPTSRPTPLEHPDVPFICSPAFFDSSDGCDCECGFDPDCARDHDLLFCDSTGTFFNLGSDDSTICDVASDTCIDNPNAEFSLFGLGLASVVGIGAGIALAALGLGLYAFGPFRQRTPELVYRVDPYQPPLGGVGGAGPGSPGVQRGYSRKFSAATPVPAAGVAAPGSAIPLAVQVQVQGAEEAQEGREFQDDEISIEQEDDDRDEEEVDSEDDDAADPVQPSK